MTIFNLFSKRQKLIQGKVPDVYQYNEISRPLRVQIIHIITDAIGIDKDFYNSNKPEKIFKFIHESLCREYGVFTLGDRNNTDMENVLNHFLNTTDFEKVIDTIELIFQVIDLEIREDFESYTYNTVVKLNPEDAINELNTRLKEHGVGYQFDGGDIIRVDSTYSHSEIVKPTLTLLWNKMFRGANDEYLKAHEHYKNGRNKECLADCLKAFESTMKIICNEKKWAYNQNDTSKKLIQVCLLNGLVPSFTQNQYTSLQSLLESGIPTIRNKLGGHGQGHIPQKVDNEMTRYALNLTGTNIIFLIEQSGLV